MIVKPSVSFLTGDSDQNVVGKTGVIITCMTDNQFYADPAPTLAVITTSWKAFSDACTASAGGGVTLTADKNEKRTALAVLVRNLAGYVQANCKGSLSILLSSGFPNQKTEHQPIGPLPAPDYATLSLGTHSGELDVNTSPVYGASIYNWKLMAANAPTVVLQTAQSSGASKTFACLTPGKVYVAEVNAFATAGPTDWVKSGPQMVV